MTKFIDHELPGILTVIPTIAIIEEEEPMQQNGFVTDNALIKLTCTNCNCDHFINCCQLHVYK